MNNKTRYAILIAIGIAMDFIFGRIVSYYNLPFFLDMVGTALVAVTLEPAAGLLVGLTDNFLLAALFNGPSTIWYYSISAMTALLYGKMLRKDGRVSFKRLLFVMLYSIIGATLLSCGITFFRLGTKITGWARTFQLAAESFQLNPWAAAAIGIFVSELLDLILTGGLVFIFYHLLPKKLREEPINE